MMELQKRVPNNIDECTKSDHVVDSLLSWAESLKKRGAIFAVIIAVIGVLSSWQAVVEADCSEFMESVMVFADSILMWLIGVAVLVFTYNAVALLLKALASIVYNTSVSANVALYNAAHNESEAKIASVDNTKAPNLQKKKKSEVVLNEVWTCSNCGRQNVNRADCWNCGQDK